MAKASDSTAQLLKKNLFAQSMDTSLVLVVLTCGMLAFLIRFYYINVVVIEHPNSGDSGSYYAYAWNLLHHGIFSKVYPGTGVPVPDSYRDPGYPLLIALVMWVKQGGDWYRALLFLQALLGAATVVLAVLLGRAWLKWPWLLAAGLLMAAWPHSISSTAYVLTEIFAGFLVTLGVALVCLAGVRGWVYGLAAGMVLGAAGMTSSVLLPVAVVLACMLLVARVLPGRTALALALGSLLMPGLWAIRSAGIPNGGQATETTSHGRAIQNFVQGSRPDYHHAWRQMQKGSPQAIRAMAQIDDEIAVIMSDPVKGAGMVLARMSSSPGSYLAWYFHKPFLLWDWDIRIGVGDVFIYPAVNSPYLSQPAFRATSALSRALNPWLVGCAAVFCMLELSSARRRGCDAGRLACATLLAYVTLAYWLLQAEPRYAIAYRPLQLLAAVSALEWAVSWLSQRLRRQPAGVVSIPCQ